MEGAADQDGKLVGVGDLVRPFDRRAGDGEQVAEQQRVGDGVPAVLLAGGHHQRGL